MDEFTRDRIMKILIQEVDRLENEAADRIREVAGLENALKEAKDVVDVVAARLDAGTLGEDK